MKYLTIPIFFFLAFNLTGCDSKTESQKESQKALETMMKPKNAEFKSYARLQYETCLEGQKINNKEVCHAPKE